MNRPARVGVRQLLATAVIGVVAGLVATSFHVAMLAIAALCVEAPSRWPWPVFLVSVVVAMSLAAWFTGRLMTRFAPDAPGSGIPQVKLAYMEGTPNFSWHLIWVKFLGGVLSIGTGSSLGREGPTIHIGAALASKVAAVFGEDSAARLNAICAGSAAGLAAAFGSPLAGVTLVLEEITGGRNEGKFSGRALLAAAIAAAVVFGLGPGHAVLNVGKHLTFNWSVMALAPIVGLWAGLCGVLFQWATLRVRSASKKSRLTVPQRLAVGAALAAIVSALAFGITGNTGSFGLGETLWTAALVLLLAKWLSTVLCYGTGGCGGIFAPVIFFGGMAGLGLHGVLGEWLDLTSADATVLGLAGMTACLAAVVRAPITSILIVVEMTRQIEILPILMVASVVGVFLNRFCFQDNFYGEALRQDGHQLPQD
jgi:CIC family chloride channel protein